MTRHFTLPTALRMTSNRLLVPFFERLDLVPLDWRTHQPDPAGSTADAARSQGAGR